MLDELERSSIQHPASSIQPSYAARFCILSFRSRLRSALLSLRPSSGLIIVAIVIRIALGPAAVDPLAARRWRFGVLRRLLLATDEFGGGKGRRGCQPEFSEELSLANLDGFCVLRLPAIRGCSAISPCASRTTYRAYDTTAASVIQWPIK